MKLSRIYPLLVLSLALSGCAEEEREVVEEPIAGDAVDATDVNVGAPTVVLPEVTLQPQTDAGVTGEASFAPGGEAQTEVIVRLANLPPGTHAGHIHQGTCASPGSVVAPLQPINPGPDMTGTMTTAVPVPLRTVMNGQHLVAYHEAGGSPGTIVACGEIPQAPMS